jgi:hypothetical protein
LIIETPLGNLSSMMHFLNTMYTVYFNTKHKRCGHLFQGRYKSILIQAEVYAKELSRYIHLNPVRAEIADRPEQYPWSSYAQYCGTARREKWIETAFILRLFAEHPEEARTDYAEFVIRGIGKEIPASIEDSRRTGILGSEEFISKIRKEFLEDKVSRPDRESPQLRKLRTPPDLSLILSLSEKVLGEKNKFVRPIAIFIIHNISSLKLEEIADFFSLSVSGISSACHRIQAAMPGNRTIVNAIEEIEREVKAREDRTT